MKQLYTLLLLFLLTLQAYAQGDYIELKSGTRYSSIFRVINDSKQIRITDFRGKVWPIDHETIARVHLGDSIRGLSGWTEYNSKYADATKDDVYHRPVDLHSELADIKDSRDYLRMAGGWGIAGTFFVAGGIIMAAVSVPTNIPELAYVGAGMSTVGVVLYIPAFTNVLKAGRMGTP